jgi:hypothetical protein
MSNAGKPLPAQQNLVVRQPPVPRGPLEPMIHQFRSVSGRLLFDPTRDPRPVLVLLAAAVPCWLAGGLWPRGREKT